MVCVGNMSPTLSPILSPTLSPPDPPLPTAICRAPLPSIVPPDLPESSIVRVCGVKRELFPECVTPASPEREFEEGEILDDSLCEDVQMGDNLFEENFSGENFDLPPPLMPHEPQPIFNPAPPGSGGENFGNITPPRPPAYSQPTPLYPSLPSEPRMASRPLAELLLPGASLLVEGKRPPPMLMHLPAAGVAPDGPVDPVASSQSSVAFFPPLERKDSLSVRKYRAVTALEAIELFRRRCHLEKRLQLKWRKALCEEVFRWWRDVVAQFPEYMSPEDLAQVRSAFRDQLRICMEQIIQATPFRNPVYQLFPGQSYALWSPFV